MGQSQSMPIVGIKSAQCAGIAARIESHQDMHTSWNDWFFGWGWIVVIIRHW